MLTFFRILFLVTVVQPAAPAFSSASPDNNTPCELTFGLVEWRPGQYVNEKGEFTGLQINLINDIADSLNCKIIYDKDSWSNVLEKINSGKIDFTGNATKNAERQEYAHFSTAYHRDVFLFYSHQKNHDKFNVDSITKLMNTGFRLGLNKGYVYGEELEQWKNDNHFSQNISYEHTIINNLKKLSEGKIDGILEDPFVIAFKQRKNLLEVPLVALPIRHLGLNSHFMFSKHSTSIEFVKKFNRALQQKMDERNYESIWLKPQTN